ncbi:MAG: RNA polymerase sigma-70 factor (ECF subfamily) [Pseudohongiellaceae bacterium]
MTSGSADVVGVTAHRCRDREAQTLPPTVESHDLTRTAELIRSAQSGNVDALNRLIARYYERVRRIVTLRLGPKLRKRIETSDILQETFIAAMRTFDQFEMRDEGAFIHWLSRIAEHQIRDAADYHTAKKRDAGREVSLNFEDSQGETVGIDPEASGLLPVDALSRAEQDSLVDRCLSEMPEQYRELIILRDYEGLSWDDVAAKTGRPSSDAARMKHATAMVNLAKRVRSAGNE